MYVQHVLLGLTIKDVNKHALAQKKQVYVHAESSFSGVEFSEKMKKM